MLAGIPASNQSLWRSGVLEPNRSNRITPNKHVHTTQTHDSGTDESGTDDSREKPPRANFKPWRPVTLQTPYLAGMILLTAVLIGVIASLLVLSNRDQGIIFAKDINELPLRRSFSYLYLPTIISVIYSFLWTWVDLDIKRLEPYFQLSKPGGATGRSSLLLSYPLEFLVTLPFVAFKHRHWSVLMSAIVVILVFWGLTPTQAGIFATRTVTILEGVSGSRSSKYTSIPEQGNMSTIYAQSVYNIAWLNESLPAFMTKEYILSGFGAESNTDLDAIDVQFTGETTLYSVDISCTNLTIWNFDKEEITSGTGGQKYNSTSGCSFEAPYRNGGGQRVDRTYDTTYMGYQRQAKSAEDSLDLYCGREFLHSFFIRFGKTTTQRILAGNRSTIVGEPLWNETALFCEPTYYQQQVNATISLPTEDVIDVVPVGSKTPLPKDLLNITNFEWFMNAQDDTVLRTDYPKTSYPNQKMHLVNTAIDPSLTPKMAVFAYAVTQLPVEAYLDPETLRKSYQAAYRLLLSRHLFEILQNAKHDREIFISGARKVVTQAVVVVPVFSYAAICLLGMVLIFASILAITMPRRHSLLTRDPATIDASMDLLSNDAATIGMFSKLTSVDAKTMQKALKETRFGLDNECCPLIAGAAQIKVSHTEGPAVDTERDDVGSSTKSKKTNTGIRPMEMKLIIGAIFLALQVAAIVSFMVLFIKARREDGLALPSQSTFVRQLVQNYIPIAFATFVEPFWLLLNKLLCLLQPYEQLRRGHAQGSNTIHLDYASLPPQLLFLRAARAKHYVMCLVCFMVISANVLAVAMSGMLYEDAMTMAKSANLSLPRVPRFHSLEGTSTYPVGTVMEVTYDGPVTYDQFFYLQSNLTAGTPLPPWVDEERGYLAVSTQNIKQNSTINVQTTAFTTSLQCRPLYSRGSENYTLEWVGGDGGGAVLKVALMNQGSLVRCTDFQASLVASFGAYAQLETLKNAQPGHVALEIATMLASNGTDEDDLFCRQHMLAGWIRTDWELSGGGESVSGDPYMNVTSQNETVILCRPKLIMGPAEIQVDTTGRVQKQISANLSAYDTEQYFQNCSEFDLTAQVHQFLPDMGAVWHADKYPSDFLNYLIAKSTNDTSLLDPSSPVPTHDHAIAQVSTLYRRLFALFIGTNQDLLFAKSGPDTLTPAQILTPETRILFSTPAFIIVQTILACYIATTIFFYLRRPWKILPRLPLTVASNMAFFAASRAFEESAIVRDRYGDKASAGLRNTWTWAYGSFLGPDGKPYVGIERDPFVVVLKEEKLPQPPPYSP